MPRMNGIELASKVQQESNIHIIIYTGQGNEEVAEAAFSAGVDDYVRSEIDPSHYHVLVKRIKNSFEKKRAEHRLRQRELELS